MGAREPRTSRAGGTFATNLIYPYELRYQRTVFVEALGGTKEVFWTLGRRAASITVAN